ncbi:MAG: hypothetical protein A2X86_09790 [Bdellovibrionales bacterium GWA2_49_15]|nr:MAG: hypothetical protein A2X86_09790 [Bdellovibrionales bacterium GWA2_49_15]HAZ13074.1 hypothetical protein [Bdellovibrionales bacterium]
MKMLTSMFVFFCFLSSCAHRYPILQAEIVSMTDQSLEAGMSLVEMGSVDEMFCPAPTKDPNAFGIIDELIKNTQQKTGADFLGKATVYAENDDCISIKAISLKKVSKK